MNNWFFNKTKFLFFLWWYADIYAKTVNIYTSMRPILQKFTFV